MRNRQNGNTCCRSAFFSACKQGDEHKFLEFLEKCKTDEQKKALIQHKGSVNKNTPLHIVVKNNHMHLAILLLISKMALINEPNNDGDTPLHYAACRGDAAMIKLLIANGADKNIYNNHQQRPIDSAQTKEAITLLS